MECLSCPVRPLVKGGKRKKSRDVSAGKLAARRSTVAAGPSGYHPDLLAVGGAGRTAHARELLCTGSVSELTRMSTACPRHMLADVTYRKHPNSFVT